MMRKKKIKSLVKILIHYPSLHNPNFIGMTEDVISIMASRVRNYSAETRRNWRVSRLERRWFRDKIYGYPSPSKLAEMKHFRKNEIKKFREIKKSKIKID